MQGLLLINLGTPDAPTPGAVRRYLREFLMDPRVIDISALGRWMLVEVAILPFRPRQSAAAYAKIWDERGSPLLYHSQDLTEKVRKRLGNGWHVELGMRYGSPSIESAMRAMRRAGVDDITVFPLYPHYAASSTGSSVEEVFRVASELWVVPNLRVMPPFYEAPSFIGAFASRIAAVLRAEEPEHVLFSFHGLPERQCTKTDDTGKHCLASDACCDAIVAANRNCYRAQCFATARALATKLDLDPEVWSVSFQSRLGRDPWIRPYTDEVVPELAAGGVSKLVVVCPAFVADCLETLEEIGMRASEQFVQAGGDALTLVPSLNSEDNWADAVVEMVRS